MPRKAEVMKRYQNALSLEQALSEISLININVLWQLKRTEGVKTRYERPWKCSDRPARMLSSKAKQNPDSEDLQYAFANTGVVVYGSTAPEQMEPQLKRSQPMPF